MRILFCCPTPVTSRLGASKVYIEAAEGFRRVGWDATVVSPEEVAGGRPGDLFTQPPLLREYLVRNASGFDVVEYDHHQLPYPRTDFPSEPLFVARSVMLTHWSASMRMPPRPGLRPRIGWLLKGLREQQRARQLVRQGDLTLAAADLINLCNAAERDLLIRHGLPADKIRVFPFGLFPERLAAFRADPASLPDKPVIGFVGTFDPRKGMRDFPALLEGVTRLHPSVTLRLIGTAGLVPDETALRHYFPQRLRSQLEIRLRYDPEELPDLLAGVSVGVFPSILEGFPFGVLEMLAAGLPVVAYDAPGPPEMLLPEYLVPVGAVRELADRLGDILSDPDRLRVARLWARTRADEFRWEAIATRTAEAYTRRLAELRGSVV
jgi:glycosyltransferase involved in cell wall biosynthesis